MLSNACAKITNENIFLALQYENKSMTVSASGVTLYAIIYISD